MGSPRQPESARQSTGEGRAAENPRYLERVEDSEDSLYMRPGKKHMKGLEGPVLSTHTGVYFHQPDWNTHNPWGVGKSFLRTGK